MAEWSSHFTGEGEREESSGVFQRISTSDKWSGRRMGQVYGVFENNSVEKGNLGELYCKETEQK